MIFLLDTNTCIVYINGRSPSVRDQLLHQRATDVGVCSVVKAELFTGAMKSVDPSRTLAKQIGFLERFVSLPFDDEAAEHYAHIRSTLEVAGTPISGNDLMIAAIARANGLTLVTHNTREFGRVPGLTLEDWEA